MPQNQIADMKIHTIIAIQILLGFSFLSAQDCDEQRFYEPVFNGVDVDFGIKYGEAPQPNILNPNASQELNLNFYEPEGDTMEERPLIIWAFGGSFVAGSNLSPDIVQLCNYFSRLGYVNASIEYRLTTDLIWDNSTENAYTAVMKGMSDMKAAVRFFYKDALTDNEFRVDTSRIYVGGVSAGAIAAVHLAYLDEIDEVPAEIYQDFIDNGGFEGNSGNLAYGSDIAGVINLSGGLKDTEWMKPGDEPIVSMHGTEDGTVPYGTEILTTLGVNLLFSGSASVHERADEVGIENAFYTWHGAGHTPFVLNNEYMDTTQRFVRDFLYDQMCNSSTPIFELSGNEMNAVLSPNPSSGLASIDYESEMIKPSRLEIIDINGRRMDLKYELLDKKININGSDFPSGIYFLKIFDNDHNLLWTASWIKN